MRVTNRSMTNSYLHDIQKNLQKSNKLNTQLNTGKEINKVSDDPYEAIKVLNLQKEINSVEKQNYNCDEILGWMDTTDDALDKIGTTMSEIKTLLVSISGAYGTDEINAIKSEVNEKIKQIGEALNTTYAGKYIFGGSNTSEPPVSIIEDPVTGLAKLEINSTANEEKLKVEISDGITINYNLSLNQVLNGTTGLDTINELMDALSKDPIESDQIDKLMNETDEYLNHVLNNRSTVGARTNTVETVKSSNEGHILTMKESFSLIQDVDLTEKYIELKAAEMIYASSMQVGARMIQPTILDYLR